MKKPVARHEVRRAKSTRRDFSELELRMWCVAQATRWPTVYQGGTYAGAAGAYPSAIPAQHVDVNLLARAEKILDWVKSK